jgi:hypothetical protein
MRTLIFTTVLLAACGTDDAPRTSFDRDGFSIATLPGWSSARENGTLVLRRADGARGSLAVRSAPLDGEWVEPRSLENVVPATQRALEGLPGSRVKPTGEVAFGGMTGASFDVSFRVHGKGSVDRRHIVLVGGAHVFHVFATAQRGRLGELEPALQSVLSSIREEG